MIKSLAQGWWQLEVGDGPVVAASLHSGHAVCPEMEPLLALSATERLREEDPFTEAWTAIAPTRIVGCHSRFGFDLNRPREKSIYLHPDDAWGLWVWKDFPDESVIAASLHRYDEFYEQVRDLLDRKVEQYGRFVLIDLHSYNHRRDGHDAAPAPPELNPEINVGTGTVNRRFWGPIVDRFLAEARARTVGGRQLDVRENIRFRGGEFPRWVNTRYGDAGCALAIEVKKFFMDEWSGEPDLPVIDQLRELLQHAVTGVTDELQRFDNK
jgi:N-formylglutamate deformylase